MFATQQHDKVQKKAAHDDAPAHAGPETEHSAPSADAPALQASGDKAAPAMSQWAEGAGVQMKAEGHGDKQEAKKEDPLASRMVQDDRFDEEKEVVQNGHGRIINISIVNGMSRIMIGMGRKQGVRIGMEGYIKKGNGMLADFQIDETRGDRVCVANVDVTPDMMKDHHEVVINPSAMPKSTEPQKDMKSRIVGVSIVGGKTKIMIGRGVAHGARAGQIGYIVGNGGRRVETFEVSEAGSTHSSAFVEKTIDQIKDHHEVILNTDG
jgi:hypothetical protein